MSQDQISDVVSNYISHIVSQSNNDWWLNSLIIKRLNLLFSLLIWIILLDHMALEIFLSKLLGYYFCWSLCYG